jgi:hypothetical protein
MLKSWLYMSALTMRVVRHGELVAHEAAHDPGDGEEHERRDDEAARDHLVVDLEERAHDSRLVAPGLLERLRRRRSPAGSVADELPSALT